MSDRTFCMNEATASFAKNASLVCMSMSLNLLIILFPPMIVLVCGFSVPLPSSGAGSSVFCSILRRFSSSSVTSFSRSVILPSTSPASFSSFSRASTASSIVALSSSVSASSTLCSSSASRFSKSALIPRSFSISLRFSSIERLSLSCASAICSSSSESFFCSFLPHFEASLFQFLSVLLAR